MDKFLTFTSTQLGEVNDSLPIEKKHLNHRPTPKQLHNLLSLSHPKIVPYPALIKRLGIPQNGITSQKCKVGIQKTLGAHVIIIGKIMHVIVGVLVQVVCGFI